MPPKKRAAPHELSRLTVLAAGDDEAAFSAVVLELLASGDRVAREAALMALMERPLPAMRDTLRTLYVDLDGDPGKQDPGAHLRTGIAQILLANGDARDIDIALRAVDTRESSMGVDCTGNLRALGLRIIAAADPDIFPYVAAEHVDDASDFSPEPANTALQLLANTGHQVSVYQWLISGRREPALVEAALDLLSDAPAVVMARCVAQLVRDAVEKEDEPLLTKLAETIVERQLADAYPSLSAIIHAPISNELYGYLALLLAGTNRPPLLAILEDRLRIDIRRRSVILDALHVRTTPEQEAILRRWNDEGEVEE